MKIYVGPKARVVGVRKVASNGTLSGLKSLAGKNVLVVVPARRPRIVATPEDYWVDARLLLQNQGQRALQEFRLLRERLEKTTGPATRVLVSKAPPAAREPLQNAEAKLWRSVRSLEKRVARLLQA